MTMAAEQPEAGWLRIRVPLWLWGNRPFALFELADLTIRRHDTTPGTYLVRTSESYNRVRPSLVRLLVVDPSKPGGPQSFDVLTEMFANGVESSDPGDDASAYLETLRTEPKGDLAGFISFYQLAVLTAPRDGIADQARVALEEIGQLTIEGRERAFTSPEVFAVQRREALLHRIKLVSVLLRLEHDQQLSELGPVVLSQSAGDEIFASSSDLHRGLFMFDTYIGPLMGCLSPGVWGFASFRGHGPIIFSFGSQVSGTTERPYEPIRTLPKNGPSEAVSFERLLPRAGSAAARWWTERLNDLFAVVSDPHVFANSAGEYSPVCQLQAILTIEQLFLRVASIQSNYDDTNARRVLLFTVLDTLESLTGRSLEIHCNVDFATRTLAKLEAGLDVAAASLLMPGARRAVVALSATQEGFFLRDEEGRVVIDRGSGRTLPLPEAVALYLKLLRDATHGHGGNRERQKAMTEQLLTRHNGQVPHDVAQLGYLYLLDVLANPDRLRKILAGRSKGAPTGTGNK